MAERTRITTAGVSDADRSSFARILRYACIAGVAVGFSIASLHCNAAQPGAKSRKRTVSQRDTSQRESGRGEAGKPGGIGIFGLRSLFGGDKDETPQPNGKAQLQNLPLDRLTPEARQKIGYVAGKPTLYRRLPAQAIRCDRDLFLFLVRKTETIIGIWDLMGITNVQAKRIAPYQLDAVDGSGTSCRIDLLYGDSNLHIFYADGMYDGKFTQKPVTGKGIFVFRNTYSKASDGATTVNGTLDCYVKFESLGADLLARSLGGLIGKSADHNYVETAKFISQISQACETNPDGMLEMAQKLPQVDAATRDQFARVIQSVAQRSFASAPRPRERQPRTREALPDRSAQLVRPSGIRETQ